MDQVNPSELTAVLVRARELLEYPTFERQNNINMYKVVKFATWQPCDLRALLKGNARSLSDSSLDRV